MSSNNGKFKDDNIKPVIFPLTGTVIGTEIILNPLTGTGTWIIPETGTELERKLFIIVGTGTNSNDNYFQAYLCFSTFHVKFYFFVLQTKINLIFLIFGIQKFYL